MKNIYNFYNKIKIHFGKSSFFNSLQNGWLYLAATALLAVLTTAYFYFFKGKPLSFDGSYTTKSSNNFESKHSYKPKK